MVFNTRQHGVVWAAQAQFNTFLSTSHQFKRGWNKTPLAQHPAGKLRRACASMPWPLHSQLSSSARRPLILGSAHTVGEPALRHHITTSPHGAHAATSSSRTSVRPSLLRFGPGVRPSLLRFGVSISQTHQKHNYETKLYSN